MSFFLIAEVVTQGHRTLFKVVTDACARPYIFLDEDKAESFVDRKYPGTDDRIFPNNIVVVAFEDPSCPAKVLLFDQLYCYLLDLTRDPKWLDKPQTPFTALPDVAACKRFMGAIVTRYPVIGESNENY